MERLRGLEYDPTKDSHWTALMVKEGAKPAPDGQPTYVFNNVRDSAQKVYAASAKFWGVLADEPEQEEGELEPAAADE